MQQSDAESYDLGRLEDLFQCMDVLTKARVALSRQDPGLAAELGKIAESLMALSEAEPSAPRERTVERPRTIEKERIQQVEVVDQEPEFDMEPSQGDVIIDVLTGEVISASR